MDLQKVLSDHKLWLESDGEEGERADLRYADLRGAAFVEAKGFIFLPVQDQRGYSFTHATLTEDGWKIRAGCRLFTIEEAKAHWGESYMGDREIGDMYLYAVEWLAKKLARESE